MMPKVLFEMPKMGTFNLHASFFLITEEQLRSIMQLLMVKKNRSNYFFINEKIDEGNIY
jgi:methionyl-tRNA formyltransferase